MEVAAQIEWEGERRDEGGRRGAWLLKKKGVLSVDTQEDCLSP